MDLIRYKPVVVLAAIVVVIPVLTALFNVNFYLTQLTMSAYYTLVAMGLCMLMGYAGQISLGQAGFFAIGGYASALLTTLNFASFSGEPWMKTLSAFGLFLSGQNLYGDGVWYLNPWIACIAAVVLSALVAFLIGVSVLKLKVHYLAMATLGFGVIIEKIVRGVKLFGGADGITNVPAFSLLPGVRLSGEASDRVLNYFIAWAFILIGAVILVNLVHSRVGRALRSLHGSEEAAASMGVDTSKYKLFIFVIGAVFAAGGGIFLTHFNGSIGPGDVSVMKSVRYVAIVAVGGMANIWGTLTMGTLLNFRSLRGVFGTYDDAVFGAILILVMLFSPEGLIRPGLFKKKPAAPEKTAEKKDVP